MRYLLLLALISLLAAVDDPGPRTGARSEPGSVPHAALLQSRSLEAPATEVGVGDAAPDFSFQGVDGQWRRLRELVARGPMLLVFGADELPLRVIEHERERLADLGVLPLAVTDARARAARAMVQRLGLRFTVVADPQGIIAAQFNAVDPETGRQRPAWFVLDHRRRVRGLGRGTLPLRGYPTLAANALGLTARGAALPRSRQP